MGILVAGVGAVGTWLLSTLVSGGVDATGWARGETFDRLASGAPLVLHTPEGTRSVPVPVVDRPEGSWDLVLVAVKGYDTDAVAAALAGHGGRVVSVQVGVEPLERLRRHRADAGGAVVHTFAEHTGPGEARLWSPARLVTDDGRLTEDLSPAGLDVGLVEDVRQAQWCQLMRAVALNALCTVARLPVGGLLGSPGIEDVVRRVAEEVATVARLDGSAIPLDEVERLVGGLADLPGDAVPSTLQDLQAGRRLEVDALTGVVLARADAQGVPAPTVRALDALLRVLDPKRPRTPPLPGPAEIRLAAGRAAAALHEEREQGVDDD